LKIDVTIDTVSGVQKVVDARATGTLFRGFEQILKNRAPRDAPHITQRVCGVCPVSHGMASVMALDAAAGVTVPNNARVLRNLVLAANFVQSHILHFYHLTLMDFVNGPNQPPWQPAWDTDFRITGTKASTLINNYLVALEMRRKAHEMGALFGGRLPHPPTYIPGGFTTTPRADRITSFRNYLKTLIPFIQGTYLPDVATVAAAYTDYYQIGKGFGNLLAYGVFDLNAAGSSKLLRRGRLQAGKVNIESVDVGAIKEQVSYSWYDDKTNNLAPAAGVTTPVYPKTKGYSWLKAPRYKDKPYETGPLARMWVNGDYRSGISAMDRHWARAYETLKVAQAALGWLDQLVPNAPVYTDYQVPTTGTAYGLTEAPRGALGHWVKIAGGLISNYQIITPTCWNASPRDAKGIRGPLEQALIGTPIRNLNQPVEVVRVIHSFDPCLSCAVHAMESKDNGVSITLAPMAAGCATSAV
jgi:hydrogenase large subunit